jgi:hypothetical protein
MRPDNYTVARQRFDEAAEFDMCDHEHGQRRQAT